MPHLPMHSAPEKIVLKAVLVRGNKRIARKDLRNRLTQGKVPWPLHLQSFKTRLEL